MRERIAQKLFIEKLQNEFKDKSLDFIKGYVYCRTEILLSDQFINDIKQLRTF